MGRGTEERKDKGFETMFVSCPHDALLAAEKAVIFPSPSSFLVHVPGTQEHNLSIIEGGRKGKVAFISSAPLTAFWNQPKDNKEHTLPSFQF